MVQPDYIQCQLLSKTMYRKSSYSLKSAECSSPEKHGYKIIEAWGLCIFFFSESSLKFLQLFSIWVFLLSLHRKQILLLILFHMDAKTQWMERKGWNKLMGFVLILFSLTNYFLALLQFFPHQSICLPNGLLLQLCSLPQLHQPSPASVLQLQECVFLWWKEK